MQPVITHVLTTSSQLGLTATLFIMMLYRDTRTYNKLTARADCDNGTVTFFPLPETYNKLTARADCDSLLNDLKISTSVPLTTSSQLGLTATLMVSLVVMPPPVAYNKLTARADCDTLLRW